MGLLFDFGGDASTGSGGGLSATFSDPVFLAGLQILSNSLDRRPVGEGKGMLDGVLPILASAGQQAQQKAAQAELAKAIGGIDAAARGQGAPGGTVGGLGGLGGFKPTQTGWDATSGDMGNILSLARKDSGDNYNALTYKRDGSPGGTADLENMTISDVMDFQKRMPSLGHASTAVGGYQMIAPTLAKAVSDLGIDPAATKFDRATQDALAAQLVKNRGYDDFKAGKLSPDEFMSNLSKEWAILPKDASGAGSYDGFNGNRASVSPKTVMAALNPGTMSDAGPPRQAVTDRVTGNPVPVNPDGAASDIFDPATGRAGVAYVPQQRQATSQQAISAATAPAGAASPVDTSGMTNTTARVLWERYNKTGNQADYAKAADFSQKQGIDVPGSGANSSANVSRETVAPQRVAQTGGVQPMDATLRVKQLRDAQSRMLNLGMSPNLSKPQADILKAKADEYGKAADDLLGQIEGKNLPAEQRLFEATQANPELMKFIDRNVKDDIPSDIRSAKLYKDMTPEEKQAYMETKRAGANSQNTVINNATNPLIKGGGDEANDIITSGRDAANGIYTLHQARAQLDKPGGIISGFGSDYIKNGQRIAAFFGADPTKVVNTESYIAIVGQAVLNQAKALGANPSNEDARRINQILGGSTELNEATMRNILDFQEDLLRRKVRNANDMIDQYAESYADTPEIVKAVRARRVKEPPAYEKPQQPEQARPPQQQSPISTLGPGRYTFDPKTGGFTKQ